MTTPIENLKLDTTEDDTVIEPTILELLDWLQDHADRELAAAEDAEKFLTLALFFLTGASERLKNAA